MMLLKYIVVIVFLLSVLINTSAQIKKIDGSEISADSLTNRIQGMMRTANVSGVAISIFNKNKPVYSHTFGYSNVPKNFPLTPATVLYGASFSKALFAYVVMQLVDEKIIDLDKPLVNYLSKPLTEYKIEGWNRGYTHLTGDDRYKKITGRMCLDHTTGFPNWRWFESDKKLKIKFEPGSRYSYSGEGIYLLQWVIEQITGKDYESIAQQRVFKPFNMPNTSYVWQDRFERDLCLGHNSNGEPYELMKWKEASAGGSLSTTLNDYSNFFSALMQGKGLTEAAFNEMIKPQIRIKSIQQFGPNAWKDATSNDNIQLSYGLGVGVFKTPYGHAFFKEGHDDGWGHYSIAYPEKGIGVVIMTNNDNGESIFKALLNLTIGDVYTPWYWENYIPFDLK
jgi:D-alanyl-D-alanine-carboxypeptidase/D-alanyl-D-alanine-endopeptidase